MKEVTYNKHTYRETTSGGYPLKWVIIEMSDGFIYIYKLLLVPEQNMSDHLTTSFKLLKVYKDRNLLAQTMSIKAHSFALLAAHIFNGKTVNLPT
jgi:hypothetical protein